jgi:hypothetical protein
MKLGGLLKFVGFEGGRTTLEVIAEAIKAMAEEEANYQGPVADMEAAHALALNIG